MKGLLRVVNLVSTLIRVQNVTFSMLSELLSESGGRADIEP